MSSGRLEKSDDFPRKAHSHHEKTNPRGEMHGPAGFSTRGKGDFSRRSEEELKGFGNSSNARQKKERDQNKEVQCALALGVALKNQGDLEGAITYYRKALTIKPNYPEALFKLGVALQLQGNLDAAITSYRKTLTIQPNHPKALVNLGAALQMKGDLDVAIISYRKALAIQPNYPDGLNNLGSALQKQGDLEGSILSYRKALAIQPNHPDTLNNLGSALQKQGDLEGSILSCRKALEIQPNHPNALNNLGIVLQKQGDLEGSILSYRKALSIKPSHPDYLSNLGTALQKQGDLEGAVFSYKKALAIQPNHLIALYNLGKALHKQGDLEDAILSYRKVISLDENNEASHFNLSLCLLLSGDYENGWKGYERRFRKEKFCHAHPQIEQWTGHNHSPGERLLIVSEQGLGDTLQFMRYLPYLDSSTMDVSFCAQTKLHGLIQSSGITRNLLTPEEANATTTGKRLPLLSLARILKVSPDNPLVTRPYIKVAEQKIMEWQEKFSNERRPIIGINWQGNPKAEKEALQDRSLPLDAFAPVAKKTEATFLSLQKGFGAEQLTDCPFRHRFVACQEEINQTWDFVETAAIIMNCDLIITSDTAVAHVAGGLGKTTWLLLASVPDWRWGMAGERSTWYPSMRLFRQQQLGNWAGVMDRVVRALGASATIN